MSSRNLWSDRLARQDPNGNIICIVCKIPLKETTQAAWLAHCQGSMHKERLQALHAQLQAVKAAGSQASTPGPKAGVTTSSAAALVAYGDDDEDEQEEEQEHKCATSNTATAVKNSNALLKETAAADSLVSSGANDTNDDDEVSSVNEDDIDIPEDYFGNPDDYIAEEMKRRKDAKRAARRGRGGAENPSLSLADDVVSFEDEDGVTWRIIGDELVPDTHVNAAGQNNSSTGAGESASGAVGGVRGGLVSAGGEDEDGADASADTASADALDLLAKFTEQVDKISDEYKVDERALLIAQESMRKAMLQREEQSHTDVLVRVKDMLNARRNKASSNLQGSTSSTSETSDSSAVSASIGSKRRLEQDVVVSAREGVEQPSTPPSKRSYANAPTPRQGRDDESGTATESEIIEVRPTSAKSQGHINDNSDGIDEDDDSEFEFDAEKMLNWRSKG